MEQRRAERSRARARYGARHRDAGLLGALEAQTPAGSGTRVRAWFSRDAADATLPPARCSALAPRRVRSCARMRNDEGLQTLAAEE
jgi:hypothetical protein